MVQWGCKDEAVLLPVVVVVEVCWNAYSTLTQWRQSESLASQPGTLLCRLIIIDHQQLTKLTNQRLHWQLLQHHRKGSASSTAPGKREETIGTLHLLQGTSVSISGVLCGRVPLCIYTISIAASNDNDDDDDDDGALHLHSTVASLIGQSKVTVCLFTMTMLTFCLPNFVDDFHPDFVMQKECLSCFSTGVISI